MSNGQGVGQALANSAAAVPQPATPSIDPATLRAAFGCFPSGVTALCGLVDGQPVGMSISSFTSVSLDPPLVSICVARSSSTWPVLKKVERLGLSVLAEGHDRVCRSLSAKTGDRFSDVPWTEGRRQAVYIGGATLRISCSISQEIEAGDHLLVLLRVHALEKDNTIQPLVFHGSRFRQLAMC